MTVEVIVAGMTEEEEEVEGEEEGTETETGGEGAIPLVPGPNIGSWLIT